MISKTKTQFSFFRLGIVPVALLVMGLSLAPLAPEAEAASSTDTTSPTATITVYASAAPLGLPAAVQYSDGTGNWITVSGWTGTLDRETDNLDVPYEQWTVYEANFGQGPFRWVIYNADGKTAWGISDPFNLPVGDNINLNETISAGMNVSTATPAATGPAVPTTTTTPVASSAPANTALRLTNTGMSQMSLACADCSALTGYFYGLPATSWITVEWANGTGNYEAIQGWQGTADTTDQSTGLLIKHFAVFEPNFGQSAFRWAVYDRQGGTLLGYSADFTLPAYAGVNLFMSLTR